MAASQTQSFIFDKGTVTTAGTRVALSSSQKLVSAVMLIAWSTNTGRIYYGGVDVASTTQLGLLAGESVTFQGTEEYPFDLASIYLDSSVNGEGVDFVATRSRRGTS